MSEDSRLKEMNEQEKARLRAELGQSQKEANDARSRMGTARNNREYREAQESMRRAEERKRETERRLNAMGGNEIDPKSMEGPEGRRARLEAEAAEAAMDNRKEFLERSNLYSQANRSSEQRSHEASIGPPQQRAEQPDHAPPGGGWGVGTALALSVAARRVADLRKKREEEEQARAAEDAKKQMDAEGRARQQHSEAQKERGDGSREKSEEANADGKAKDDKAKDGKDRSDDRERERER